MLVLKRKTGERIVISSGRLERPIVVMVVHSHQGGARIGVDAEPDILVDREEIYLERISRRGR